MCGWKSLGNQVNLLATEMENSQSTNTYACTFSHYACRREPCFVYVVYVTLWGPVCPPSASGVAACTNALDRCTKAGREALMWNLFTEFLEKLNLHWATKSPQATSALVIVYFSVWSHTQHLVSNIWSIFSLMSQITFCSIHVEMFSLDKNYFSLFAFSFWMTSSLLCGCSGV